jgi:hypothetical protein
LALANNYLWLMRYYQVIPLLFFVFTPHLRVSAQSWSARVVDADSRQPIPYASVGVLKGSRGTVAGDDGIFLLEIAAAAGDSVRISALGYRSCTYSLVDALPLTVALQPDPITTSTVEVLSPSLGRQRRWGITKRPDNVTFFFQSNQLGTELGSVIALPHGKDYWVKAVNFYLIRNNYGRVKFRFHLYRFDGSTDGLVDLLPQTVFVTTELVSGWVNIDLSEMDIVLRNEQDVLVSLEWLEHTNPDQSAEDLQFGAVLAPAGNIHYKRAVESPWEFLSKRYYGLRAKLGVHIEGYELTSP